MSGPSTYNPTSGFERWLDARLPLPRLMHDTMQTFPTPRNLNIWYTFGGILTFCLGVQIITGVVLAMEPTEAFRRGGPRPATRGRGCSTTSRRASGRPRRAGPRWRARKGPCWCCGSRRKRRAEEKEEEKE